MTNFWHRLTKPFLVMAPMEGVTDCAIRELFAVTCPPDVYFTEFTNADGLVFDKKGRVLDKLKYTKKQKPIVAQIWGTNLITLETAAKKVADLGFDGIDINLGCPDKSVVKRGAGAALIENPENAKAVINAVKKGSAGLSVSVKTRLGYDKIVTEEWLGFLLKQNLAAISIHARTAKQQSRGKAKWEEFEKIVRLKNKLSPETIIIGNGNILSFDEAKEIRKKYGVDGVMIGRGIFKNPYVFDKTNSHKSLSRKERILLSIKIIEIFESTWQGKHDFNSLKKFIKSYLKDFNGSKELRLSLMNSKTAKEALKILNT